MNDRILYNSSDLNNAITQLNSLKGVLDNVSNGLSHVSTSGEWWSKVSVYAGGGSQNARSALRLMRSEAGKISDRISDTSSDIRKTITAFDAADRKIAHAADSLSQGNAYEWGTGTGSNPFNSEYQGIPDLYDNFLFQEEQENGSRNRWEEFADGALGVFFGFLLGSDPSASWDMGKELFSQGSWDWWNSETSEDGNKWSGWLGKWKSTLEWAGNETNVDFQMGKVEKSVVHDGSLDIGEDKSLFGYELGGGLAASLFSLHGDNTMGNDMFGMNNDVDVSVGNGELEGTGKLGFSKKGLEAYASGKAMVSALEGKVSGTFDFLGLEITGVVSGYAGAAGVEGEFGFKEGKFVMKGGAAAGVGGSVGLEIGFNETGWENFKDDFDDFVDFVTFWD